MPRRRSPRADRRQLREQRRLEAGELGGIFVRQHEGFLRAHAVLSPFSADRAFPSSALGPRDMAPFLRLASARVLLIGTAARRAAPGLDMVGFLRIERGCWDSAGCGPSAHDLEVPAPRNF
jgi:hypothetical protein